MTIEMRTTRRIVTPRYKGLLGEKAIEEYTLDLKFEVIYANAPKRGRKPLKKIKTMIKEGRMHTVGSRENLDELQWELFAIIRNKKEVADLGVFIKSYLYTE
jgi:hypothetical protein